MEDDKILTSPNGQGSVKGQMAARYQERLSMSQLFPGSSQEEDEKTDLRRTKPFDLDSAENHDIPEQCYPSMQLATCTGRVDQHRLDAADHPVTKSGEERECIVSRQSSDHLFTRHQIASHSPVMKELIEKFEMRKTESKNSARKATCHREKAVSLMARNAWSPKPSTAQLDIDPCALTSSSFSDLSDSVNTQPSKESLARSSAALLGVNEGRGDIVKKHPTDAYAGDASGSFPDRSQSELSRSGPDGQGDKIDNSTNNKDTEFLEGSSPEKTQRQKQEPTRFFESPRKRPQRLDLNSIATNFVGRVTNSDSVQVEETGTNSINPFSEQWPQHVSLRGLVKKRGTESRTSSRSNSLDQKISQSGKGKRYPNFKNPTLTSPIMPPGLPRMPSNVSKKLRASGTPPLKFLSQEERKNHSVSPSQTTNGPKEIMRDDAPKNNTPLLYTSRSKASEEYRSGKTSLWPSFPRQAKAVQEDGKTKGRKVTATDRYMMFLKRNTPPPKPEKSRDSVSGALHTPASQMTSLATPLIQKPPNHEHSLQRLGSIITGSPSNLGHRERSGGEKEDSFKCNTHKRPISAAMPRSGAPLKRPFSVQTRKRPQSLPNNTLSTSNSSLGVSPLASQASDYGHSRERYSASKRSRPGLEGAKFHRIPVPASVTSKLDSSGSTTIVDTANRALKSSEHAIQSRSSNKENEFKSSPTKNPDGFKLRHDTSATSSASPTLTRHPRPAYHALHKLNPSVLEILKLQTKDHSGDDGADVSPFRSGSDKIKRNLSVQSMDSPLSFLDEVEMADTNLIPKHLRDSHRTHKARNSRDDYVLFLSSSDEDSTYLSIEDQLRKIKTKRLLQMLQGSTLMDSLATYQSMPISKNDCKEQTFPQRSASSRLGKSEKTTSYKSSPFIPDIEKRPEMDEFRLRTEVDFGLKNEQDVLQDQNKYFRPEPLQFTSKKFNNVGAKEDESTADGKVHKPSPNRAIYHSGKTKPGINAQAGSPEDKTDFLDPGNSPWDKYNEDAPGVTQYHFGYSTRAAAGQKARSPDASFEKIKKVVSDMDAVTKAKSERPKKRKMAGGKGIKEKKHKKATKEQEKVKDEMLEPSPVPAEGDGKKSPVKKKRALQKLEMVQRLTPPKSPEISPLINFGLLRENHRSVSSEKVHRRPSSPVNNIRIHAKEFNQLQSQEKRKEPVKWKFTVKPVRRLTREANERWPIKSRIPLVDESLVPPTNFQSPMDMWAKYRRFREDFNQSDHPCKVPLSRTFRYMVKVAPYQEWKLHRWNHCSEDTASVKKSMDLESHGHSGNGVSKKEWKGKAMTGCVQHSDSIITVGTKIRYWRAGPLRMPHLLYTGVGIISVGMAYLVMWLATCQNSNIDIFCTEREDDISCLISHITGNI